ncbi:hypothetical protein FNH22_21380 [Fulvivirga sp. M361]|uniref:hypothetical protein n=1 Tax=Fulvivirga sp. M361 TaxID=2594266 RepID=UPI00117ACF06|nr:hypothetical protein [Fulvivirga sp. M361]TRX53064.1 hypothetical protein FNH22_21380 [Fulvivirga sp. M361]
MKDTETKKVDKRTSEIWAMNLLESNPILFKKLKDLPLGQDVDPHELLTEVVKFMYLVSAFHVKLTPSLMVDLAWHEFILFTKAYERFCRIELGSFIHHTPDDNNAANNKNYLKTIQRYISLFGEPPVNIWGELSRKEWRDSQCGSCNSN